MKTKRFYLLALFLALASGLFAGIKTVSNNPSSPGQYTNLQTAIDAASLGDTLMIAGSTTDYGTVNIAKPLVLVGAGYNNPYGNNTTVGTINLNRTSQFLGASGTRMMGLIVNTMNFAGNYSGGTGVNININNVLIERCKLGAVTFAYNNQSGLPITYQNDSIRNCLLFNGGLYFRDSGSTTITNVYIHNNIIDSYTFNGASNNLSTVFFRNNLIIDKTTAVFSSVYNMIIENNIFYGAEPTGCTNCVFTRNLTYLCTAVPGAGNLGSSNLNTTNPMFVNYPPQGGAFLYTYDFHLQPSSPGKNYGTDGTDIGIYGGMLPYDVGANPHFPQMMTLTLPSGSSVPAGGTLNVHFTAKKQN